MTKLRLGLNVGYWAGGPPPGIDDAVAEAERVGFDSIWCAEAYGSDALTPLAWWGSRTERLRLGTGIAQISARQPTALAMAAMTLDHLSGGRFALGIGASGPQVVEGWYGRPFEKPLARTREVVGILRDVWARNGPVTNDGPAYPLPLKPGPTHPGVSGLGKPLKSSIRPLREDIPILLAAEGPKNVAMAAEICDGWIAMLLDPQERFYADALAEGFARDGARHTADDFEVAAMVPFIVHDDVEAAVDMVRPFYALYFGGMGAKGRNFHANVAIRMGYEEHVDRIQALYLDGRKDEAAAAIPSELIQRMSLLGPADKIRHDLAAWEDSFVTTILVNAGDPTQVRQAAEIVLG
ncbi:MAG: LLM class F420-dependent oxidoreductase [Solirubrobacteraceae bacterium]|nr:LLM class F420-dependent oxidoreductase [Solirubrobacteraceae bacterium]